MNDLQHLFANNQQWADEIKKADPEFFSKLAQQQTPEYLWIGCSDSRVPANQIVGLLPGELFVHRNVANVVIHTDLNCLAVLQYAVAVLHVKHVIVCGHYGCGGVKAAMKNEAFGLINNWLQNIKDTAYQHRGELEILENDQQRVNRLCELNVIQQARNISHTAIVQDAWRKGQLVSIHGWIYDIQDGLLKDIHVCIDSLAQVPEQHRTSPRDLGSISPHETEKSEGRFHTERS